MAMVLFDTYGDFLTALRDGRCDPDTRVCLGSFWKEPSMRRCGSRVVDVGFEFSLLPMRGDAMHATWRAGDVLDLLTRLNLREERNQQ